jgi:hypothetical protein
MDRLPTLTREETDGRWELIRDAVVFQIKLAMDALRDFAFAPISITAAVVDLITGGSNPGRYFYAVLALGGKTESWINLFGAPRLEGRNELTTQGQTIDSLVRQVEGLVVEQYERGGLTSSAKEAIDRSLDAISRKS